MFNTTKLETKNINSKCWGDLESINNKPNYHVGWDFQFPAFDEDYLKGLLDKPYNPDWEFDVPSSSYKTYFDLPGCKKKDTSLELCGTYIYINSTRTIRNETKSVQKMIALPKEVDTSNIKASMEDGVLNITVPKLIRQPKPNTKINIS